MKIEYDSDIPSNLRPQIAREIKESIKSPCSCGCDEVYVSLQARNLLDVKCYDCGTSFFELELEIDEETLEH